VARRAVSFLVISPSNAGDANTNCP
jgi:hypothetical protein